MSKEMNKLRLKVTKYDMMCGLFMSLIIGLILSFKLAIVYLLGVIVAVVNFRLSLKGYEGLTTEKSKSIFFSTIIRILIIVVLIYPIRAKYELIAAYLVGLISHYPILIYCTLRKKGSA